MAVRFARPMLGGASLILAAIAVSGLAGYVLMPVVASQISPSDYRVFATFWAALYLVILALSGVQQEIARATRPRRVPTQRTASAAVFALVVAVAVIVVVVASSPLWVTVGFKGGGWLFVAPLAVGAAGYVAVAVVTGILYGLEVWRLIGTLIAVDGVLKLIAVIVVLPFSRSIDALAWAVVLPIGLTPCIFWAFIRRSVPGRYELDVGHRNLVWNTSRTVAGSVATGVLMSGFPFILGVLSPWESDDRLLGALFFAIVLVRAPLATVSMAMQSYLVVAFASRKSGAARLLALVTFGTAALTVVLTAAAGLLGPWVLSLLGSGYVLSGWVLAGLVGTSGLLAILSVTGAFTLSRGQHGIFSAGWIGAATVTVGTLVVLPGPVEVRTLVALALGPAVGVAVHAVGLGTQAPPVR